MVKWSGTGGVNFRYTGGVDQLCTLRRGEGLYGWVRYRGYMRDSRLKTKQVHTSHPGGSVQPRAHRRRIFIESKAKVVVDFLGKMAAH